MRLYIFKFLKFWVAIITIPLVTWVLCCLFLRLVGISVTENDDYKLSWIRTCGKYGSELISLDPPMCKIRTGAIVQYYDQEYNYSELFWRPRIMKLIKPYARKSGIIESD